MGYSYCPGATPAGAIPNLLNDCCNDQATCYPGLTGGYVGGTLCCTQGVPSSFPCESAGTNNAYICCNGVCHGSNAACPDPHRCKAPATNSPTGSKCCMAGTDSCVGNGKVECCASIYNGDFGSPSDVEYCVIHLNGDPECCRDHGVLCGDQCCPRSRQCAGPAKLPGGVCCPRGHQACNTGICCDPDAGEVCMGPAVNMGLPGLPENSAGTKCCDLGPPADTWCAGDCCKGICLNPGGPGESCCLAPKVDVGGLCCDAGSTNCGGACCAAGRACVANVCCPAGQVDCNGACGTPPCYP